MASVDVIIPNYNYARFLPECVQSVLAQGMDALRVVIIDNHSSDDSVAVARALAEQDCRIEVVARPCNLGPQASFNQAIDLARADYLLILCSDDFLTPGALGLACAALERHPEAAFAIGTEATLAPGASHAEPERQSAGWRLTDGDAFIADCCRTLGFTLALGAVLVRTSMQQEVGHFRAALPYTDDLEMAMRLARKGPVLECDFPLGVRREHTAQMSETQFTSERMRLSEREAAFDSFFAREGRGMARGLLLCETARFKLAGIACRSCVKQLLRRNWRAALELFLHALRWLPAATASIAKAASGGAQGRIRGAKALEIRMNGAGEAVGR